MVDNVRVYKDVNVVSSLLLDLDHNNYNVDFQDYNRMDDKVVTLIYTQDINDFKHVFTFYDVLDDDHIVIHNEKIVKEPFDHNLDYYSKIVDLYVDNEVVV